MSVHLTGAEQVPPKGELLWCVIWNEHVFYLMRCVHIVTFSVSTYHSSSLVKACL